MISLTDCRGSSSWSIVLSQDLLKCGCFRDIRNVKKLRISFRPTRENTPLVASLLLDGEIRRSFAFFCVVQWIKLISVISTADLHGSLLRNDTEEDESTSQRLYRWFLIPEWMSLLTAAYVYESTFYGRCCKNCPRSGSSSSVLPTRCLSVWTIHFGPKTSNTYSRYSNSIHFASTVFYLTKRYDSDLRYVASHFNNRKPISDARENSSSIASVHTITA